MRAQDKIMTDSYNSFTPLQPSIELGDTLIERHNFDSSVVPTALAQIQKVSFGFGEIVAETEQAAEMVGADGFGHFHFEGAQPALTIQHEMYFVAIRRPPVVQTILRLYNMQKRLCTAEL
jgi:hypothetical protein